MPKHNFSPKDQRIHDRLNQEFIKYFNKLESVHNKNLEEWEKCQIGSYLMVLDNLIPGEKTIEDLVDLVTDDKFNKDVFGKGDPDLGIDAVYIDEINFKINLFNFKYVKEISEASLPPSEISKARVFFDRIYKGSIEGDHEQQKIIKKVTEIRNLLDSGEDWEIIFTFVSNGVRRNEPKKTIKEITRIIEDNRLESLFSKEIIHLIDSDEKEKVDALIQVKKSDVIEYTPSEGDVAKTVIIKLPLLELLRITSDSDELRALRNYSLDKDKISLQDLINNGVNMSILRENIRQYVENGAYNKNIINTLNSDIGNFLYFNNGLTVLVDSIEKIDLKTKSDFQKYNLNNFRVVNGGQTLRSLHKWASSINLENADDVIKELLKSAVIVKLFEVKDNSEIGARISEYTNSQNKISGSDLMANHPIQIELQKYLKSYSINYIRQSGTGIRVDGCRYEITKEVFAQILFSIYGRPNQATSQKRSLFTKYYEQIFNNKLKFNKSVDLIVAHQEIIDLYNKAEHAPMDIKYFYIHWLMKTYNFTISHSIDKLEKFISSKLKDESRIDRALIASSTLKELIDWLEDEESAEEPEIHSENPENKSPENQENKTLRVIPEVRVGLLAKYLSEKGKVDRVVRERFIELEKLLEKEFDGKSGFGQQKSNQNHWTVYAGSRVGLVTVGANVTLKLGFTYKHGTKENYDSVVQELTDMQKNIIGLSDIPGEGLTGREALIIRDLEKHLAVSVDDVFLIIKAVAKYK